MKKSIMKKYTLAEVKKLKGKTDWKRLRAMKDEDIDLSDIPELDATFWKNAKIMIPKSDKQKTSVKLDQELVDWFKKHDKSYINHIQAVLKTYIVSHR